MGDTTVSQAAARLALLGCLAATAGEGANLAEIVGPEAVAVLRGKTILLAGATGNNGSEVLAQLTALGLAVRPMARDVEAAREDLGAGYDWVQADVTQPETLEAALRDVDIVISAVATSMPFGGNRPEKVDYEGTINLARAAQAAGARRFVIITSSVSGQKDHFLNYIGGDVLIWKGRAEEALMASGLDYVIVGPAGIDDDAGAVSEIRVIPRSAYTAGMRITRADLASVVIAVAGLPQAANRTFSVINGAGPASGAWRDALAGMPAR